MASVLYLALLLSLSCVLWSGADVSLPSSFLKWVALHQAGIARSCPRGWNNYGNRCFIFQNNQTDWATAERACHRYGGNLASVHNKGEFTFLQKLIRFEKGSYQRTWLGGHDAEKEGVWLWSDGSRFSFTQWGTGEPNNLGGNEHCMEIYELGDMNDAPCTTRSYSICAKRR
ncbi:galactose-specific lectin nattectin-like [Poeciliopsis prolifica]|uniref:galactose-specific lectin nattectin-like n=1 Tax=Poeciliopsis prolifica TaxID=188132 RepID=UPI002413ECA7|nr:galactose-specific lectin nattectin-like [Poeciliopsis prolifica]